MVTSETLEFAEPNGEMLCTITITLGDGQISLVGAASVETILSGEAYSVPIVGGSGAFSRARGEAIFSTTDAEASTYELTLVLR